MNHQQRGMLTDRIKEKSKELLGYEMNKEELRLIAHIQYVMADSQKLEPNKINEEERAILKRWKKDGHIEGGAGGLRITREFWDILCEIVFLGYVDLD